MIKKTCLNCKHYGVNTFDDSPCSKCIGGPFEYKWEPIKEVAK